MPRHDSRLQRNLNDNFGKASSTKPATKYGILPRKPLPKGGHHDYIPVPPPGKKFLWSDADKGGVSYLKNHPPKTPQTKTNTYPVILRISGGFKVAPHLGSGKIRHEKSLATWHRFPNILTWQKCSLLWAGLAHRGCHSPRQIVRNKTSTP